MSDENVEHEDTYLAALASLDQFAAHHDVMAEWLGERASVLRAAGLPEDIQLMMLARLVDIVLPVENPMEDMLAAIAREAQRRLDQEAADQEGDDDDD